MHAMQPNLEEAVRAVQEKRLATLREEWEARKRAAIERKFAIRYHKVRFFERVKLERLLKKLQRSLASSIGDDQIKMLESKIQQVNEDLQYVLNFPKGEKYVSILRDATDPVAQQHLESERQRLREIIKKQLAEEALLAEPDEGRTLVNNHGHNNNDDNDRVKDDEDSEEEEDDFFLSPEENKSYPIEHKGSPSPQPQTQEIALPKERDDQKATKPTRNVKFHSSRPHARGNNARGAQLPSSRGSAPDIISSKKSRQATDSSVMYEVSNHPARRTRAEGGRKRRKKNS